MVVFGYFVFNSFFTFLYVTCSFLDILQFLSISHLWIFRFTAHKSKRYKYPEAGGTPTPRGQFYLEIYR